jgi:hypothetical protein
VPWRACGEVKDILPPAVVNIAVFVFTDKVSIKEADTWNSYWRRHASTGPDKHDPTVGFPSVQQPLETSTAEPKVAGFARPCRKATSRFRDPRRARVRRAW